jgi:PKD repeat protein
VKNLLVALLAFGIVGCPNTRGGDDDDDDDATGVDDDDTGDDDDSTPQPGAPDVTIDAPADGALLNNPESVSLVGGATDDEDGDIPSSDLEWSSDVDGDLGSGDSIVVELSVGEHELTLTASDSDGNLGWANVDVTVVGENQAPSAFIDDPSDGSLFIEGTTIAFEGHADDPEDGDLSGGSLFWTSSEDGSFGSGTDASLVGASLGVHTIVLTAVDSQGEQGIASISVEIVPVGTNLPPVVVITSPANSDAFVEGDTVELRGEAEDPEDGTLTAGSLSWTSNVDGLLGTGDTLDVDTLSTGAHTLALIATDSDGLTGGETVQIVVNQLGNDAPVVEILAPANTTTFVGGTDIDFLGTADDPEDGPLTGTSLTWTSSLDGDFGDGEEETIDTLSTGVHTITLTGEDSGGGLGLDTIVITVLAANTPPAVTLSAPSDGSTFTQGDTIDFEGSATDPEDGVLTGSALVWQSNLFGQMGTGAPLAFSSLPAGLHQITLIAVDSGGLSGSDSIEITIDPSAVNLPPVAALSGPSTGEVGVPITFDGSGSVDPDGSIVDYEFEFGDTTDISGTDDTVLHTYTAEGTFTVTLTVTDDEGETGQASLTVDVIIPEPVPEVVWDTADTFGSRCHLELDSNDLPHVAFRNTTHLGLWYAAFDGSSWSVEFVDGPGFDIGGEVAADIDLALDSSDTPHLAYRYNNSDDVRYATPGGAGWTREDINTSWPATASTSGNIAIALDPVNGERPTVAFTHYDSYYGYHSPTVAYRTATNTWVEEQYSLTSSGNNVTGGLTFTASGVAWLAYDYYEGRTINWSSAQGFFDPELFGESGFGESAYMPMVLDASNQPIVLADEGTYHRQGPSDWIQSDVEPSDFSYYDIGINDSGDFYLGLNEGGDIALIHGDPYWNYEYQGPMDNAWPGIDVDSTGKPWACFFRDGNLMVY